MSPNRSAVHESNGLGARLQNFNNKACRLVPTRVVYVHVVYTIMGKTWTFVYN